MQTDEQLLKAWQEKKSQLLIHEEKCRQFIASNRGFMENGQFNNLPCDINEAKSLLTETTLANVELKNYLLQPPNWPIQQEMMERKSYSLGNLVELILIVADYYLYLYYHENSKDRKSYLTEALDYSNQARTLVMGNALKDTEVGHAYTRNNYILQVFSSFETTLCNARDFLQRLQANKTLETYHKFFVKMMKKQNYDPLFLAYLLEQSNYYIELASQPGSTNIIEKIKEIYAYLLKINKNFIGSMKYSPLSMTIENMLERLRLTIPIVANNETKSWLEGIVAISSSYHKYFCNAPHFKAQIQRLENEAKAELSSLEQQEESFFLEESNRKFSDTPSQFEDKPEEIDTPKNNKHRKTNKTKNENPPQSVKNDKRSTLVNGEKKKEVSSLHRRVTWENKPFPGKKTSHNELKVQSKSVATEVDLAEAELNFSQAEDYRRREPRPDEQFSHKILHRKIKFFELARDCLTKAINCFDKAILTTPARDFGKLQVLHERGIVILNNLKKDMGELFQIVHAKYQELEQMREEAKKLGSTWLANQSAENVYWRAKKFMYCIENLEKIRQLHSDIENLPLPPFNLNEFIFRKFLMPSDSQEKLQSQIALIESLPDQALKMNFDFFKASLEARALNGLYFFSDRRRLSLDSVLDAGEQEIKRNKRRMGGRV